MNSQYDDNSRSTRPYSPFWALCLLFVPLILLQLSYVRDDLKQRNQIQATQAQVKIALGQAETLSQITDAVGRDLLALSTNSDEAAKIVSEFKIQINNPPKPSK